MSQSILFVCLGNICRSPTGEAVMRHLAAQRGLDLHLDSAGTAAWHIGKPPHPPMQATTKAHGIDMADLRARQVAPDDLDKFDLIIAMDQSNLRDLSDLWPDAPAGKLRCLTEFGPADLPQDVPDPYYTDDYEGAFQIVQSACTGLADGIAAKPK